MSDNEDLKSFPTFASDDEAARFVEEADLAACDLSGFRPVRIRIGAEPMHLDVFLSAADLAALERRAQARGITSRRLVEEAIEREISGTR